MSGIKLIQKIDWCRSCVLCNGGKGFVPADGSGDNGVLLVGEAAGEHEAAAGQPFIGKAGHYLFNALNRIGIPREGFKIHNVLSCRPPNNKLAGMHYEQAAIERCATLLDQTIESMRRHAAERGRTFVIVTLGKIAFKRILGLDDKRDARLLKSDYYNYPFWSERYGAWVIACAHPSYLMRGNHHELPVLQFGIKRALEIAEHGLTLDDHTKGYLLDPDPLVFKQWMLDFKAYAAQRETYLSYDIETPMKQNMDEEDVAKEEDSDYTILRVSFSYRPNEAVSVPWRPDYLPVIADLMQHPGPKVGWNNQNYDAPRVMAQMPLHGDQIDAMLAWHVLNSALPKGLGFVTPFYAQTVSMWKHLSDTEPAFYNAKDADMALRNWLGIAADLKGNNQWKTFERHVIRVNRIFTHMRDTGVLLDSQGRLEAETRLTAELKAIEASMEAAIPDDVRKLKVYKKTPKSTDGLVLTKGERNTKKCPGCSAIDVKAEHFKSIGKKRLKAGEVENPCHGLTPSVVVVESELWAQPQQFKVSKVSLLGYQKALRHRSIMNVKENKVTFDEKAIMKLQKRYPKDPLYPLILDLRSTQKLLGTYIGTTQLNGTIRGGMPVGPDGRIHTTFTHNPSTLRSASQNPNLQNLPRGTSHGVNVRDLIVAAPGHTFYARDFSGIEAVLVGYFANAPDYIRLAKVDVHSFYTAYALHQIDGRVSANDLPLLSWDDDKLKRRLADIKKEFKEERNGLYKHLVHGNNFMQGVRGSQQKILLETGVEPPYKTIETVMGVYFELFPAIKKWHTTLLAQADKDGYLRNPFGYVHRFHRVYEWTKNGSSWDKRPGADANKVIAFLPQSTAAGIIKEAMLRLYEHHYESAGRFLRLLVHDELFFEVPDREVQAVDGIVKYEMELPVPELALPPAWGMGDCLGILTEEKMGPRWASMH
jgi:uracil-DNA glycosylase family 4